MPPSVDNGEGIAGILQESAERWRPPWRGHTRIKGSMLQGVMDFFLVEAAWDSDE